MATTGTSVSSDFTAEVRDLLCRGRGVLVENRAAFGAASRSLKEVCAERGLPCAEVTITSSSTIEAFTEQLAAAGVGSGMGSLKNVWGGTHRFGLIVHVESAACEGGAKLADIGNTLSYLQQERRLLMVAYPERPLGQGINELAMSLALVTEKKR